MNFSAFCSFQGCFRLDKIQSWTYTVQSLIWDLRKRDEMDAEVKAQNTALNQVAKRLDEQYHAYAAHCGLSDPAFWILYILYKADEPVTQNDLAHAWCYPKQTINFTVSSFVKKGYVTLQQRPGARSGKSVCLTAEGMALCRKVIAPLMEAEERSLLQLTEPARKLLVGLSEKQCLYFEQEVQTLLHAPEK